MYQPPRRGIYRPAAPPARRRGRVRRLVMVLAVAAGIFAVPGMVFLRLANQRQTPTDSGQQNSGTYTAPDGFNTAAHTTTDADSLWVVVNKQHVLKPKDFAPSDLTTPNVPLRANITTDEQQVRTAVAAAFERMVTAAKADGVSLNLQSGYRSHALQVSVYSGHVKRLGQAAADTQSARPGHSEHQTGLALDVGGTTQPGCNVAACFADTPEGKWVAAHAPAHGFIIRYPAGKEQVTGYEYEPWHLRYVGTALAQEMQARSILTLEEFFDIAGGESY